jgi:uncharacterized protein (TIGR04255 family)
MARYKNNFLDTVIVEIRYEDVSLAPLDKFKTELNELYPIQKQENAFEGVINFDAEKGVVEQSRSDKVIWSLMPQDNSNKIIRISKNALSVEYNNRSYTNSEELVEDVDKIIEKFIDEFKVSIINRVGLRYANRIPISFNDEKEKIDNLITDELIASYRFAGQTAESTIARSMTQQMLKFEDCDMTFIHGVWNNDFPNRIVKEDFILDFDCFTQLPVATSEINIMSTLTSFNGYIEGLFERSIKQKVRDWMELND